MPGSCIFSRPAARALPLALAIALFLTFHLAAQTTPQPPAQAPAGQPLAPLSAEDQSRVTGLQSSLQSAIAARDAHAAAKILNQLGDLWLGAGNLQNAIDAYN
ncbi:MAG: hypothetical protein WCC27_04655, partial [Acidobacteriaceae bacterium]